MHDLVYGMGALAGWIALTYKIRHLRRDRRNPALRTICIACGLSAVSFTMVLGPVYRPLDALLGVPNLAKLFIHASLVLFSVYVLRLLAFWEFPRERARRYSRRILACGLMVVAVMTILIVLAPIHAAYTIHFWKSFASESLMLPYLMILLVSLTVGMVAVAHRAWRFSSRVRYHRWLYRGLRVTTVGAVVGLGYCGCRGGYLIAVMVGAHPNILVDLAVPFASTGQILLFIGLTIPSWGWRLDNVGQRVGRYRSYRALYPLWLAFYEAFPDIALHPPGTGDGRERVIGDLDYRLYRRMVEIWDGRLRLLPRLRPEPGADSRVGVRARVEALAIRRALADHRAGLRAQDDPATGPRQPQPHPSFEEQSGQDLVTELDWLVAVSRAFSSMSRTSNDPSERPVP